MVEVWGETSLGNQPIREGEKNLVTKNPVRQCRLSSKKQKLRGGRRPGVELRAAKTSALLFAQNVLLDSTLPSPERRAAMLTRTHEREQVARFCLGIGGRQHENAAPPPYLVQIISQAMWS